MPQSILKAQKLEKLSNICSVIKSNLINIKYNLTPKKLSNNTLLSSDFQSDFPNYLVSVGLFELGTTHRFWLTYLLNLSNVAPSPFVFLPCHLFVEGT